MKLWGKGDHKVWETTNTVLMKPCYKSVRDRAAVALKECCHVLRLKKLPNIRWFTPRKPFTKNPLGLFIFSTPDSIWLNDGLPEEEILEVVAHETKHLADHAMGWNPTEARAVDFEDEMTGGYTPTRIVHPGVLSVSGRPMNHGGTGAGNRPGIIYPGGY